MGVTESAGDIARQMAAHFRMVAADCRADQNPKKPFISWLKRWRANRCEAYARRSEARAARIVVNATLAVTSETRGSGGTFDQTESRRLMPPGGDQARNTETTSFRAEVAEQRRIQAMKGDLFALHQLGLAYQGGLGVQQDDVVACSLFRIAADRGFAEAQQSLGRMYSRGRGVPKDLFEAARWFTKAAEQGNPLYQRSIGIMYRDGRGVPKDLAIAAHWLRRARKKGDIEAGSALSELICNYRLTHGSFYSNVCDIEMPTDSIIHIALHPRKANMLRRLSYITEWKISGTFAWIAFLFVIIPIALFVLIVFAFVVILASLLSFGQCFNNFC